jgi:predicted HTH transcriptional regulator
MRFFLGACIDQVAFMQGLMRPDTLRTRILLWTEEEIRLGKLPAKSGKVLEAILYRGEVPRGDVDALIGTGERNARRMVAALVDRGVLTAEGARGPLRLAFPAALAHRWMPGLFPEQTG